MKYVGNYIKQMFFLIKRKEKSEYTKNFFTLAGATAFSQIFTIVGTVVCSRLYSADDYGILGIFISILGLINTVSMLFYHTAIIFPKKDNDADGLLHLCFYLNILSCGLFFIGLSIPFVQDLIFEAYGSSQIKKWFFMLFLGLFAMNMVSILSAYANRFKMYQILSISRVITSLSSVFIAIGMGLWFINPQESGGLVWAYLSSLVLGMVYLFVAVVRQSPELIAYKSSIAHFKCLMTEHRKLALYTMPAEFVSNFANQIPLFFLGQFGEGAIGLYTMVGRIFSMPTQLVIGSVAEVFRQTASAEYAHQGTCRPVIDKTVKVLMPLSMVITLCAISLSPYLFPWVLGQEWAVSGVFAQIMASMVFIRFVSSPLSYVFLIAQKNRFDLVLSLYSTAMTYMVMYLSFQYTHNVYVMLGMYSLFSTSLAVFTIFKAYQLANNPYYIQTTH